MMKSSSPSCFQAVAPGRYGALPINPLPKVRTMTTPNQNHPADAMRSRDDIQRALATINRVEASRSDVIDETSQDPHDKVRRVLADPLLRDLPLFADAMEWCLGINSDPATPNLLAEFLRRFTD